MYDAVEASTTHARSSEVAAAAVAAHDVLVEYFPAFTATLDADLATSLAAVPAGPAKDTGAEIGHAAADSVIASRVGDGRNNPATDYDEVRRLGSANSVERTAFQTDTARFFNSNSAIMVSDALLRRLDEEPMGLRRTGFVFAAMHVSMTGAVIQCWRLKYDVGFWRPLQAIAGAADDGNDATAPEPGWAPLIPNPSYSDYVSGHGCLTGPAAETIRLTIGAATPLVLHSLATGTDRTYQTLSALEHDAFHARIWGGLHFRDAMDDAYLIAHETADEVVHHLAAARP